MFAWGRRVRPLFAAASAVELFDKLLTKRNNETLKHSGECRLQKFASYQSVLRKHQNVCGKIKEVELANI